MTTPEGQESANWRGRQSDVVENFKTGGPALRPDYESPERAEPAPDLLLGHRLRPPYVPRAGYDLLIQAMSGLDEHHRLCRRRRARRRAHARGRGGDRPVHRHVRHHCHPGALEARQPRPASTWRCWTWPWPCWRTRARASWNAGNAPSARATRTPAWCRTRTFPRRTATCRWRWQRRPVRAFCRYWRGLARDERFTLNAASSTARRADLMMQPQLTRARSIGRPDRAAGGGYGRRALWPHQPHVGQASTTRAQVRARPAHRAGALPGRPAARRRDREPRGDHGEPVAIRHARDLCATRRWPWASTDEWKAARAPGSGCAAAGAACASSGRALRL